MNIYLKHFLHGTKVAFSDLEAARDEMAGWVRYNPHKVLEVGESVNPVTQKKTKKVKE